MANLGMSDTSPHLVSVVLNWNDGDASARCLKSLTAQSHANHDVVLVDNGSTDGSAERLTNEFQDVEVIRNEENLGFSGGMNVGIRAALAADADYVWVLNNDVVVPAIDTVERLIALLEAHHNLGVITPKVMHYPHTEDVWFIQGLVNWPSGNSLHATEVVDASKRDQGVVLNDFVPFCSALFKRSIFEDVGLLPEEYFLYREDVELCSRITAKGYAIGTDPEVEVYHEESTSSGGGLSPTSTYYTARNRWLLWRRMNGRVDTLPFLLEYVKWSGRKLGAVVRCRNLDSVVAWAQGTLDGFRDRRGRGRYP